MKTILLSTCLFVFATSGISQDSSKMKKGVYKFSTDDKTLARGYLSAFSDSGIYVSSTPVTFSPISSLSKTDRLIDYKNLREVYLRRKGATGRGLLFGAMGGAVAGALLGFISGDDPPCTTSSNDFLGIGYAFCEAFRTTAGEKAAGGAIVFGSLGGITGTIVGALARKKFIINGSKNNFQVMRSKFLP
jgi:hypothetical protein